MKAKLAMLFYVSIIPIAIVLAVWYEMTMWSECRETNSFWYCMRVLGK